MLDAARAIGAPSLRKIALYFVLHLLLGVCWGPGWAAEPLVVATARDLQELTHATDRERGVLLVHPCVLYGSCCAKYAAAFFKMSRSSFKRTFSFRRRLSSSYTCSSLTSFSWRSARCYFPIQVWNVFSLTPRSRAVCAIGWSDSTASFTARSLNSAGYFLIVGWLIEHTSYDVRVLCLRVSGRV